MMREGLLSVGGILGGAILLAGIMWVLSGGIPRSAQGESTQWGWALHQEVLQAVNRNSLWGQGVQIAFQEVLTACEDPGEFQKIRSILQRRGVDTLFWAIWCGEIRVMEAFRSREGHLPDRLLRSLAHLYLTFWEQYGGDTARHIALRVRTLHSLAGIQPHQVEGETWRLWAQILGISAVLLEQPREALTIFSILERQSDERDETWVPWMAVSLLRAGDTVSAVHLLGNGIPYENVRALRLIHEDLRFLETLRKKIR